MVGSTLWIWCGSSVGVVIGKVICSLSLVPFSCAVVRMVGNALVAARRQHLRKDAVGRGSDADSDVAEVTQKASERTRLLQIV